MDPRYRGCRLAGGARYGGCEGGHPPPKKTKTVPPNKQCENCRTPGRDCGRELALAVLERSLLRGNGEAANLNWRAPRESSPSQET